MGQPQWGTKKERDTAVLHCLNKQVIFCRGCGAQIASQSAGWVNHFQTQKCITLRADAKNHFNGGLLLALQPTRFNERDDKKIAILTSAALSAANIGYATQATLFDRGSPELMGLVRLGAKGLGTAVTVAANVANAIELVEQDVLKPLLRGIVTDKVPVAVL